ncbi:C40 family peptidase [Sulfurisoma sediminicola]|uniref:Cell wall-associated NlpC family hydrolase n=1 Tax=Sulfurisoma sediminicola TaxID=1381557 RepID=A0A497XQ93_9PROT|nr:C40 family peptidase [Sulfurisoma sediminicola]RLJ68299.1 cell wall-associated NlpC family hydrolase [Sulfurisoma sediminicola]
MLHRSFPALTIVAASSTLVLSGCGLLSLSQSSSPVAGGAKSSFAARHAVPERAQDVVLYALGLVETGYRFGGKNPEAGLDCSGMVSYVFDRAAGLRLGGSAADIAQRGRLVGVPELRPGDLVFFNTRNKPYSHVGIYIGDGRFVHAPNSNGKVRTDSLQAGWFAARFEEARTYFE